MAKTREINLRLTAKDLASGVVQRFGKNVRGLNVAAFAAGGAVAGLATRIGQELADAVMEGVRDAHELSEAYAELDASLGTAGERTVHNREALKSLAAQLERNVAVDKKLIIQGQALGLSMGANVERTKKLSLAALDLAAATGQKTNQAFRNLAKTLGGQKGELGELIPEVRELTEEQLRQGAAIDIVAAKYEGRAAAQADSWEKLRLAIKGFQRELGGVLEKLPALQGFIGGLTAAFNELSDTVRGITESPLVQFLIEANRRALNFGATAGLLASTMQNNAVGVAFFTGALKGMNEEAKEVASALEGTVDKGKSLNEVLGGAGVTTLEDLRVKAGELDSAYLALSTSMASGQTSFIDGRFAAEQLLNEYVRLSEQSNGLIAVNEQLRQSVQATTDTVVATADALPEIPLRLDALATSGLAAAQALQSGFGAFFQSFVEGEKLTFESVKRLGKNLVASVGQALVSMLVQRLIVSKIQAALTAGQTAAQVSADSTRTYTGSFAWMSAVFPPAAPGFATSQVGLMLGGIPGAAAAGAAAGGAAGAAGLAFNRGGIVPGLGFTDSVPAFLTPGEGVLTQQETGAVLDGRAAIVPTGAAGGGGTISLNIAPLPGAVEVAEAVLEAINDGVRRFNWKIETGES